jgi:ParB family chromosome partitioning protein
MVSPAKKPRQMDVDPRTLVIPELRVTSYFDEETVADLQSTIRDIGIIEPPIVVNTEKGMIVIDGANRVRTAIAQGVTKVTVIVREGTEVDAMKLNLITSYTKGKHRLIDEVRVIGSMYTDHGVDIDDLVKSTGMSRDRVEGLIIIAQAGPELAQAVDDGALKLGHAAAIAQIADRDLRAVILHQQLTYGWTVKGLQDHIAGVMHERENPTPQPVAPPEPQGPVMVQCHYCKEPHEAQYVRSIIVCPTCDGAAYATIAAAMAGPGPATGQ